MALEKNERFSSIYYLKIHWNPTLSLGSWFESSQSKNASTAISAFLAEWFLRDKFLKCQYKILNFLKKGVALQFNKGWNWPWGFGEHENVKSLQTDCKKANYKKVIRKAQIKLSAQAS